jgi:hypothetical protein
MDNINMKEIYYDFLKNNKNSIGTVKNLKIKRARGHIAHLSHIGQFIPYEYKI